MGSSVKNVTVVLDHELTVALIEAKNSASVIIRDPEGGLYHEQVDLLPLLAGGLSREAALGWVASAVAIGIKGTDIPKTSQP